MSDQIQHDWRKVVRSGMEAFNPADRAKTIRTLTELLDPQAGECLPDAYRLRRFIDIGPDILVLLQEEN